MQCVALVAVCSKDPLSFKQIEQKYLILQSPPPLNMCLLTQAHFTPLLPIGRISTGNKHGKQNKTMSFSSFTTLYSDGWIIIIIIICPLKTLHLSSFLFVVCYFFLFGNNISDHRTQTLF